MANFKKLSGLKDDDVISPDDRAIPGVSKRAREAAAMRALKKQMEAAPDANAPPEDLPQDVKRRVQSI